MQTLQRTVLALALAASLALSTPPAFAGPKAAKPPPPAPSLLTTHEQVCQWWGIIYHATAIDRDRRIPITTTIEMARKIAFDSAPSDPTKAARLAEHLVTAVRDVYTTPAVSPDQYRYVMELACINGSMAPETAPAAAGPKY